MNILYTTNNEFVAKVGTSICSVFENNSEVDEIIAYIIGQNISLNNKKRLLELAKKYNRTIELIELKDIKKYFPFTFDTLGWNPIILARLVLDELLPDTVERVLYLDGDTIDIRSIVDLWNTDLGNNIVGACIEATVDHGRLIRLGMEEVPYVNSGVLLINLKQWRKEKWGEKIIKYYCEQGGDLFAPDQDAINGALKGKIYYLLPKYNFYNIYWFYPYEFLKQLMGASYYYNEQEYKDSLKNPVIIHYLGEERPWRKGNRHRFKSSYQKYLVKTPWKDEKEEIGWEFYYICWRIFNFFMRPVPKLRYEIINNLIPLFMKWRKKQLKKIKR